MRGGGRCLFGHRDKAGVGCEDRDRVEVHTEELMLWQICRVWWRRLGNEDLVSQKPSDSDGERDGEGERASEREGERGRQEKG